MSNSHIAKVLFDKLWNERDKNVVKEIFDPNYKVHHPAFPEEYTGGLKEFLEAVEMVYNAFPDMMFVIDDLIEQGDKVAVRWSATGHHEGMFFYKAPTNKKIEYAGICILRIKKNKIVEAWVMDNSLTML